MEDDELITFKSFERDQWTNAFIEAFVDKEIGWDLDHACERLLSAMKNRRYYGNFLFTTDLDEEMFYIIDLERHIMVSWYKFNHLGRDNKCSCTEQDFTIDSLKQFFKDAKEALV